MIVHVAKRTQLSQLVDEVYVCTDSDQIRNICIKHNIPVLLTSSDHTNGTERIASVSGQFPGSFIVDVQGDEPLIQPENIDTVVDFTLNCDFKPDIVIPTIPSIYDSGDSLIRVLSSTSGRVMYLSRSTLPYPFKSRPQFMNKHLSTICFSPGSLERYISFPGPTMSLLRILNFYALLKMICLCSLLSFLATLTQLIYLMMSLRSNLR